MKDEPNKITATLKVVITGEFYDDEASEETLRYCVEQDLEDAGFDVDIELLKEQEPIEPVDDGHGSLICGNQGCECGCVGGYDLTTKVVEKYCNFCPECGRKVKWDAAD